MSVQVSTNPPPPGSLVFLLDSAERSAWREWLPLGLFRGVTTNPVLLQAAGVPCTLHALATLVGDAFELGAHEVQVQTWGRTRQAYLGNGRALAAFDPRIVVKVPTTVEGIAAAAILGAEGVRLTMTAVYNASQALLAGALGAAYAAPYFGRMNDAGRDGFGEIVAMGRAARAHGGRTRILVASLRQASDVARLAAEGLDTFTFSPKVAADFFADEATRTAVEAFEAAAER
jgi:transaldolase